MLFVGYKRCSTSNKAEKWLQDNGIEYEFRDIKGENPSLEELKKWHALSGYSIKKLFNTSGMLYREMGLKDKLKEMSEEEQLKLLSTNGLLVKRPIAVTADFAAFGFKEAEWEASLK